MVRILCLACLIILLGVAVIQVAGRANAGTTVNAVAPEQAVADLSAVTPAPVASSSTTDSSPSVSAAPVTGPEPVMEFNMTKSGNVSLDFREADIKNVLKVLSYKSGINMIAGPEVVGLVNIQLKDVPWQKALDVILSTYGYSYEQKGTIIMVTTVENLKKRREDAKLLADQEPVATETFVLNFSKAEEVVKSMDKMKTARGSINFDVRTNAVIVTDVSSNLELMKEVVKKLDTVTPQVLIEAKIIKTSLGKDETMGVDWLSLSQVKGTVAFPSRAHSFPWTTNKDVYLPAETVTTPTLTYGTLSISTLNVILDALKKRSNTKSVSNPRLVTMDNQTARIQVGDQYPVPQYTYSAEANAMQVSGWNYIDTGLIFKVTPHINSASLITMEIEPQVTKIGAPVVVQTTSMPILSTEVVKTTVMIKDGETLVIAGLISDDKDTTDYHVPILGDIPILGIPFHHKTETTTKTELLIFLTPHIITQAAPGVIDLTKPVDAVVSPETTVAPEAPVAVKSDHAGNAGFVVKTAK
ncbi:MAG: secretin N-terminal domain-containing protein [Candidatus Omnitrophota bacterium]